MPPIVTSPARHLEDLRRAHRPVFGGPQADPATVRLLSSASVWEIVIKHQLGKLSLPAMPGDFVPSRLATTRTEVLEISARHALRVAELPEHHRDPFDRMLVAQALVEGIPFMTSDRMPARYQFERLRPR